MNEVGIHRALALAVLGLAVVTFVALTRITAPYGRHRRDGWGPSLPNRLAWVLMEAPSVLAFGAVYALGARRADTVPLILLALWQWHYVNRAFVYPLRLRTGGKRMPALVMALGMIFNGLNAYLNARWISHLGSYDRSWLVHPAFVAGVALFAGGWYLNIRSDAILRGLRAPGDTEYRVPHAGPFRWVSSPNYLGELLEWIGWALCTFSLAGLAFAVYTAANLVPRALANHRWYRERFPDYPTERRALVPFLL